MLCPLSCLQQCLGSPVLGYLAAGILIGPYGLSIIRHVHATKAVAEFGVVFLLFNIGLEVGILICSYSVYVYFDFTIVRRAKLMLLFAFFF